MILQKYKIHYVIFDLEVFNLNIGGFIPMRYWHFQINIDHIPSNPIIMDLLFIVPTESLIPQNLSGIQIWIFQPF